MSVGRHKPSSLTVLVAGTSGGHDTSGGPPTVPGAPGSVVATAGHESASLTWSTPGNGGSPITGYEVTPYIGASAQTPILTGSTSTSYTVTGLTDGTTYTFAVAAINAVGTGSFSSVSNSVTPTAGASAYVSAVEADSPSSYWRLNDASGTTAVDSVGSRTGVYTAATLSDGALITGDATSNSVGFNGTTSQVAISAGVPVGAETPFTIEAVAEFASFAANERIAAMGQYPDGGWGFGASSGANPLMTFFHVADFADTTTILTTGRPYHMAATWDGSTLRMYVNGKLTSTQTTGDMVVPSGFPFYIGRASLSGAISDQMNGKISEVAYYTSVLTGARILAHAQAAGLAGPSTVGTSTATLSGNTITLSKPAGVEANDLIVILCGGDGEGLDISTDPTKNWGSGDSHITPPSGFTSEHFYTGSGGNWITWLMWRVADGTEGSSFVATFSQTGWSGAGGCIVLRGIDPTHPFIGLSADVTNSGATTSTVGAALAGYTAISLLASVDRSGGVSAWPSGWDSSTDGFAAAQSPMTVSLACDLTEVDSGTLAAQTITYAGTDYNMPTQYALKVANGIPNVNAGIRQVASGSVSLSTGNVISGTGVRLPSSVKAGNTVVVGIQLYGQNPASIPQISSCVDPENTYALATNSDAQRTGTNYSLHTAIYHKESIVDMLSSYLSITLDQNDVYPFVAIWEIDPMTFQAGSHVAGQNTGAAPTIVDTGSITPAVAGGIAFFLGSEEEIGSDAWTALGSFHADYEAGAGAGATLTARQTRLGTSSVDLGVQYGGAPAGYAASGAVFHP